MPYSLEALSTEPFSSLGPCPFYEGGTGCQAAFNAQPVDRRRTSRYCAGSDHDLCPLSLAKVLRGSNSRYCGNSGHDLAQK